MATRILSTLTARLATRWHRHRTLIVIFTVLLTSGCNVCGSSVAPTVVPPPAVTVTGVTIAGMGGEGTVGDELSITLTASLSDQSTQDVTTQATWESSDANVATVSSSGRLVMVGPGECEIKGTYKGVATTRRLSVVRPSPGIGLVAGVLSDATSGRAVVGARVEIVNGVNAGLFTVSDGNGYYAIPNIVNGQLTLRVTRDGYIATEATANVLGNTQVDIRVTPVPPPPYAGTYNVSLTVVQDTCLQVFPAASGQVQLSGTATTITVRIIERGITRSYNGTIAGDGTFSAVTGNGSTSSTGWSPSHDYTGSVTGRVSGNSVSGTERLNFTSGCPGQVLVINFGGAR